jgi:hypothetical protein
MSEYIVKAMSDLHSKVSFGGGGGGSRSSAPTSSPRPSSRPSTRPSSSGGVQNAGWMEMGICVAGAALGARNGAGVAATGIALAACAELA